MILLPLLLGACADMFQEKIAMGRDGAGSLSDLLFVRAEEITQLPTPSEVYVADRQHPTEIRISWSAVTGASSYSVERAVVIPVKESDGTTHYGEATEDLFEVRAAYVAGTSYTDSILTVFDAAPESPEYEYRYYYRISAENAGLRLEPSLPTVPEWGMLFSFPRRVEASKAVYTDKIEVKWEKVDKAASYVVYRSDSKDGIPSGMVTRVPGNMDFYFHQIPDELRGKDFYYFVAGVSGTGAEGLKSSSAYGYTRVEGAPGAPQNVDFESPGAGRGKSTSKIKIKWDADLTPGVYYAVFRSSSVDSSLTRLTGNTTVCEWEDSTGLQPGVYYYYQVQAIVKPGEQELKGPLSDPLEGFLISPPTGTAASKSKETGAVSLTWYPALGNASEQAGYSYKVYTANSKDGPFGPGFTVGPGLTAEADGYLHKNGLPMNPNFFRIATVNSGVESGPGEIVTPAPFAAFILDATRAANWGAAYVNPDGVYSVRVTWQKPADDTPDSYHIYRSTGPDSGFRRITDTPVPASAESGGQFSYEDKSEAARPGRFYYYQILSLNVLGQGANYSETRQGYGALTQEQFFREYVKTVNKSLGKLVNMNKAGAMDKLGDETKYGTISGSIAYDTPDSVLSAIPPFNIYITYNNYADFYIGNDSTQGRYFILNGQSNTHVTSTDGNGYMLGTVTAAGMYPGTVDYSGISIVGQQAAGGTYLVTPTGFPSATVDWTLGRR
ncbi:MAG: hypothetical protein LBQ55_04945 [Treponema sp.]|nr:hypothetical protein [Treponema sp.]